MGPRASIQLMEFIEKEDMRYLYYAPGLHVVPIRYEICFEPAND